MKTVIAGALCAIFLGTTLSAQAQVSPEDQIKYRKASFSFAAWNMGKIKAQVIDGSVEYNQQQVDAAAVAIAAVANSGLGALFGPGSDQDVGRQTTRAKPELFANMADVAQLAGNFAQASNNLVEQAATGDQGKIRAAFGEVGQTCKACHDKYRN